MSLSDATQFLAPLGALPGTVFRAQIGGISWQLED
jgi:hypothetical protein